MPPKGEQSAMLVPLKLAQMPRKKLDSLLYHILLLKLKKLEVEERLALVKTPQLSIPEVFTGKHKRSCYPDKLLLKGVVQIIYSPHNFLYHRASM
jgi:hypothetical protein